MTSPRKLHIKSYGCQMNVYDAQRMVDTLAPEGFVETASAEDADLGSLETLFAELEALFRTYGETGGGKVRKYLHDAAEAAPHRQEHLRASASSI